MHWQIRARDTIKVEYINPIHTNIEMIGCKLINKKNVARRVYKAGVKDVCGWIECDKYYLRKPGYYSIHNLERLKYNPIVDPYWRREDDDGDFDWDNYHFDSLITNGKNVHILEEVCYS
jgi:hypothetical protein